MKIRNQSMIATTLAFAGLMSACATTAPPAQLVEARSTYAESSSGLAAQLSPTELYDAKKVLDKADQEFAAHGDTNDCRDLAYIAQRKLVLANVKARTEQDRQKIAEAVKAGVVVRDVQVKDSQAALATTRETLKQERQDNHAATTELRAANQAQGQELDKATIQLDTEKQARLSAEGKLAGAMKDLATVAAVKEEARGMVITLSGSVLFASGKFALLNTATTKLDQVAEALKAQDGDKRMVVEGHTDSQGSDRVNQPLSLNRGNAVRDYLVSRGVASEKITAVGLGSTRPIVDNKSAENRANNRRVEIIISPAPISAL
jgi:outer membrane protein OmpA-like peptidoglycan-associated protein